MMYSKPKGVRYVDMCIWIDNNAYSPDCDDMRLFEYIYHLAFMLARKRCFFQKNSEFDDFARYVATDVYMRYRKSARGDQELPKIKSILNYLKKVIYPRKVEYLRSEVWANCEMPGNGSVETGYALHNRMQEMLNEERISEFRCALHDIPMTMRSFMRKLPVSRHSAETENLYISCLLSFLNRITLSNSKQKKLANSLGATFESKLSKLYKTERSPLGVSFHVGSAEKPRILVLTKMLMGLVAKDIGDVAGSAIYSEDHASAVFADALAYINDRTERD